jgi:alkylated DNA repair dioxygenase AlkB
MSIQLALFDSSASLAEGFVHRTELLSAAEEQTIVREIQQLTFKPFEFHGFIGKRRIVSFGWRYDFNGAGLQKADDIPMFLLPCRAKAAAFAGLKSSEFQHVLLTEHAPGAAIGWHKDRSVFGDVVGISLVSSCVFRLRRRNGARWDRASVVLRPRSAYLLAGAARSQWEHSIPPVAELRYSITFRNFKAEPREL